MKAVIEVITNAKLTWFPLFFHRFILHRVSTPHNHFACMNGVFHHHRFICIELSFGSKTFKESFAAKTHRFSNTFHISSNKTNITVSDSRYNLHMLLAYFDLLLKIAGWGPFMINCFGMKYFHVLSQHSQVKCYHFAFVTLTIVHLQLWSWSLYTQSSSWHVRYWSCLGLGLGQWPLQHFCKILQKSVLLAFVWH